MNVLQAAKLRSRDRFNCNRKRNMGIYGATDGIDSLILFDYQFCRGAVGDNHSLFLEMFYQLASINAVFHKYAAASLPQ